MNKRLQQRLIGAAVIIALAVIFLPMLLNGGGNSGPVSVKMKIPPEPSYSFNGAAQPPPASTTAPLQPVQVTPAQPIASQSSPASAGQPAPAPLGNASTAAAQPAPTPRMVEPKVTPPATPVQQAAPAKSAVAPASQSGSAAKKPSSQTPASSPVPAQNLATTSGKPVTSAWVVQVSALTVESSAKRLRDQLRKNGFAAYIDRFDDKGKVFYRVRVGPKLTRSGAEAQRAKLDKTLKLKGIVVPYK